MELKDFVKQTILQICQGVKDAQEEVREIGGYASPAVRAATHTNAAKGAHFGYVEYGQNVFLVDFDVAVTASDSIEGGGSGKISVVKIISAEAGEKTTSANESTSRIQFKVPLALPVDEESKQKLDDKRSQNQKKIKERNDRIRSQSYIAQPDF